MILLGEFQFATWNPRSVSSLITNYRASEHQTGTNLKKSKKTNGPPSGLLQGWDHNLNKSHVVGAEDASDRDSMVQYGGFLEDVEDDEIKQAAMHKSTFNLKSGVGKKIMVRSSIFFSDLFWSITI